MPDHDNADTAANGHHEHEANERTALLAKSAEIPSSVKATPLPVASVATIAFCRLMEPMAITVIFPFVNQMVADTGVDPSEVGYQAGLIESLFTLAQFFTILQWGRLSDRIGRKPVILTGLAGCSLSVFAFGLSRTIWQMIFTRAIAGMLNGNVGVLKSSLGELTDHTNEARAFSFMPVAWTLGAALGPMLGGLLSNPAKRFPYLFGHIQFFREYKYALPCFVGGLFPLIGIVTAYFFLQESLPRAKVSSTGEDGRLSPATPKKVPSMRAVLTRRVCLTLANYAMLAFTSIANAGIFPLFLYTPVKVGGLGFSEAEIGLVMSAQAILTSVVQAFLFTPIQRCLGTVGTFRLAAIFYPLGYTMYPLASYLARKNLGEDGSGSRSVYVALAALVVCLACANLCYSCNMLLINAAAPSQHLLGTLNGVAQMLSSLVRSAGLAIGPALFALSIRKHLLGGQAIWLFMIVTSLGLSCTVWNIETAKADWRDDITEVGGEDTTSSDEADSSRR